MEQETSKLTIHIECGAVAPLWKVVEACGEVGGHFSSSAGKTFLVFTVEMYYDGA